MKKKSTAPSGTPFDFERHGCCHCPVEQGAVGSEGTADTSEALHLHDVGGDHGHGPTNHHDHDAPDHAHDHASDHDHDVHGHHGHDHGDHHDHGSALGHTHVDVTDRKRLLAALVLTLSMMIAEIVGGLVSGSLSLLSDAGHMLTDAAALLLSFLALKFAAKPSDERRTYGFFRFEILSAFTNALTLILMAVVISWEAIQRLHSPEPIRAGIMMAVAAVGLVVNLGGMALLSKSKSMNVRGAFLHVLGDALSSVGVLVAAAITWWTGWTLLDPILSIVIAAVIAFGAIRLLRQAIHILIEGAPDHAPFGEVVQALLSIGGVTGVHDLHIWTIGQNKHSLTAHVVVDAACALDDYARILAEAREVLAARFRLDHSTLQLESAASQAVASAASVASEGVVPKPAAGV